MKHFIYKLRSQEHPTPILATSYQFEGMRCVFYKGGEEILVVPRNNLECDPWIYEESGLNVTWEEFVASGNRGSEWEHARGER